MFGSMLQGPLDMYDGAYMAGRGRVCVVGANYRLGVLGAMVTWEQEGDGGNRGNQGNSASFAFD